MNADRIIMPSNTYYKCICCGACCINKWQIHVDEKEKERFRDTDWNAVFERENPEMKSFIKDDVLEPLSGFIPPVSTPYIKFVSDFGYNFKTGPSGCVFLNQKKLCIMHSEKGFEYKSHTCKAFPIKVLYLPGNTIQVGLSFVCPGVINNSNEKVTEKQVLDLISDDNDRTYLSENLLFSRGLEIGFGDMLKINHFLSDFMFQKKNASHLFDQEYAAFDRAWTEAGSSIPFEDRLASSTVFIVALNKIALKLHSEDPQNFSKRFTAEISNPDAMLEMIKKCVQAVTQTTQLKKNFARMITTAVISLQQANVKGMLNYAKAFGIISNMIKYSTGWGKFYIKDFDFSFPISAHHASSADSEDPMVADLLEKYASHSIFRKRMFFDSGLLRGHQYIVLFHALARWFSKAFAIRAGRKSAVYDDYMMAIRFIEMEYAYHVRLLSVLESNSYFSKYFDPLFENVQVLKSLVRE